MKILRNLLQLLPMRIHREGYKFLTAIFIIVSIAIIILLSFITCKLYAYSLSTGLILIFLFFLQFFRNPSRNIIQNTNHILAPADGKLVAYEKIHENEYFHDERLQISIFMSPLNVHINRNPVSGMIKKVKYEKGKYKAAFYHKSSTENERNTLIYQMQGNTEILVRQIAGALARRIKWYVKEGDQVEQGKEFGFIKFGSRVDLIIPLNSTVNLVHNQKVVGGETILAKLPEG